MTEESFESSTDNLSDLRSGAIPNAPETISLGGSVAESGATAGGGASEPGSIDTIFGTITTFADLARVLQPYCFGYGLLVFSLYVLHGTVIGDFLIAHTDIVRARIDDLFSPTMAMFGLGIFITLLVFASPIASLAWATDRRLRILDASQMVFNTKLDLDLARSFLSRVPSQKGVVFMVIAICATSSNLFSKHYDYSALFEVTMLAAVTLLFPFLAFVARAGVERLYRQFKPADGWLAAVVSKTVTPLTRLTRDVFPYMSVQLAFLTIFAFVCLRPGQGAGAFLTGWIWSGMVDANVESTMPTRVVDISRIFTDTNNGAPFFIAIAASLVLYFIVISVLSPYNLTAQLFRLSSSRRQPERPKQIADYQPHHRMKVAYSDNFAKNELIER